MGWKDREMSNACFLSFMLLAWEEEKRQKNQHNACLPLFVVSVGWKEKRDKETSTVSRCLWCQRGERRLLFESLLRWREKRAGKLALAHFLLFTVSVGWKEQQSKEARNKSCSSPIV